MSEERVQVRHGFFPVVTGDAVSVDQAGAAVILCRSTLHLTQGGGQIMVSGGDTSIHQGGANLLAAAGDVSISQGGALVAAARSIRAEQSYIGVAIAPGIDSSGASILMGPREVALLGAVAGVVMAVITRLLGGRQRR